MNFIILVLLGLSMSSAIYSSDSVHEKSLGANSFSKGSLHKGEVKKILKAGTYTYVQVKGVKETLWAATTKTNIKKGSKVEFLTNLPMQNFKSKSLKRTFKTVYFVSNIFNEGEFKSKGTKNLKKKTAAKKSKRGTYKRKIKKGSIKKSDYTVLDIWNKREFLKGKEVLIRAKVVKVTPQVMKKNWIHLQDGSGNSKFFDLVVTSSTLAKVGETVLLKGKVALNKDFGFGYFYKLLLENGRIIESK